MIDQFQGFLCINPIDFMFSVLIASGLSFVSGIFVTLIYFYLDKNKRGTKNYRY